MNTSSTDTSSAASTASPLVTAADAGRMLTMKPWPVVRLIEAGELRATKIHDPRTKDWHWAVSVESIHDYAHRITGGLPS